MIVTVACAGLIIRKAPWPLVLAAILAVLNPRLGVVAIAGGFALHRANRDDDSRTAAEFFDAIAGELRRGASLRQALAIAAGEGRVARLALSGQPIDLVAVEVGQMFDADSALAVAGIRLASRSGAPAAVLFAQLAERARLARQHERDRRALTAQARLSAGVVAMLPLGLGLMAVAAGRGTAVWSPGPARSVIVFGLALQVVGIGVVLWLLRAHK